MERKSIGSFIAALRKANGLTQKELADKLLVSDKAVSRWERDECAPDISLIPVIAELFGVTSDELLRGERKVSCSTSAPSSEYADKRAEKQQERLLKATTLRHKNSTFISVGLSVIGLIVGLLINFGFNRAYIGFFAACVFVIAAVMVEFVSHSRAFSALDTDEVDESKLAAARLCTVKYTLIGCCAAAVVLAFLSPLMLVIHDTFLGLSIGALIKAGAPLAIGMAIIGLIVSFAVMSRMAIARSEFDAAKRKLRSKIALIALVAAIVIFIVQIVLPPIIQRGVERTNRKNSGLRYLEVTSSTSFKQYMETDYPSEIILYDGPSAYIYPSGIKYYEVPWWDETHSSHLSSSKLTPQRIYDRAGKLVVEFYWLNSNIIDYTTDYRIDGSIVFTVVIDSSVETKWTVWTGDDVDAALEHIESLSKDLLNKKPLTPQISEGYLHIGTLPFLPLYVLDIAVSLLIYKLKLKELSV